MKTLFLYYGSLFWGLCVLSGCSATKSYFKTPNDVEKMPVTLTLTDKSSRTGLLTILLENEHLAEPIIRFKPTDSTKEEPLLFSSIHHYQSNGNTYVAKTLNLFSNGIRRGLFVKQLSADSSSIQLYQLEQRFNSNVEGENRDYYYVSIPAYSLTEVVELQSNLLVPSFESKMSAYVLDCPPLAAKIKSGAKGYTYNFLTATFKKIEVMKRIIEEYDSCSRALPTKNK